MAHWFVFLYCTNQWTCSYIAWLEKGFGWRGKKRFSHTSVFNAVWVKYRKGTGLTLKNIILLCLTLSYRVVKFQHSINILNIIFYIQWAEKSLYYGHLMAQVHVAYLVLTKHMVKLISSLEDIHACITYANSLCLFLTQTALFKILCLSQGLTSPSIPKTTIFIPFCSPHTLTHMHTLSEGGKLRVDIVVKNTKLRYFKKSKANLLLTHSSQTDPVEKTPSGLW